MQSFIWKALVGVAFTGGLMALGAGVAYADNTTSGDDGTGSGSQAVIGLDLPITLGGNSISLSPTFRRRPLDLSVATGMTGSCLLCDVGDYRCSGSVLQTCDNDQLGFHDVMDCGTVDQCDEAGKQCLTSGTGGAPG